MKTISTIVAMVALLWATCEPSGPLTWAWIIGEVIALSVFGAAALILNEQLKQEDENI